MLLALLACDSAGIDIKESTPGLDDSAGDSSADTSDTGATDETGDTVESVDTEETADTGPDPLEDYDEGDGPYKVLESSEGVGGADVGWYTPVGDGPWPVLIWSHGFARNKDNHAAGARRAATWGFLVVTPNLPNFSDHEANGEWLATELFPTVVAVAGVDGAQVAFVGHSAGGLASVVAASMVDAGAYVGLDPVDMSDVGLAYAGGVSEPALMLHGTSSYCNSDGNSAAWAFGGELWAVDVADATHCDSESDTDWVCTVACGAGDAARQELIQTYAVAWAIHHLVGGADEYMAGGAQALADQSAGKISW